MCISFGKADSLFYALKFFSRFWILLCGQVGRFSGSDGATTLM